MGKEINLLENYPKSKRNLSKRALEKSEEDRKIARKFGRDFFDGDRKHGYGGFSYNPRFWQPVIPTFQKYWNLNSKSSVLDVGCGKGFMLFDLHKMIPGISLAGIDISEYAISNSIPQEQNMEICPKIKVFSISKIIADIILRIENKLSVSESSVF